MPCILQQALFKTKKSKTVFHKAKSTIMRKSSSIRLSTPTLLLVILYLTVCIALLLYFSPRNSSNFAYDYQQDKPWRYSSLIAEYDFPVLRSEEQQQNLRDSIAQAFIPYYQQQPEVAEKQLAAFERDYLNHQFKGVGLQCFKFAKEHLQAVYDKGVVSPVELTALQKKSKLGVRIVHQQQAQHVLTEQLFSTRTAYEYILRADSLHRFEGELSNCNLNAYLQPNLKEDTLKNSAELQAAYASVGQFVGLVQAGQSIINQGDIVTAEKESILNSLKAEMERRRGEANTFWWILSGQFILVLMSVGTMFLYIYLFRRDYLLRSNSIGLVLALITLFPIIGFLLKSHTDVSLYIVPFAIVPMFVRIFLDSRTALVAAIIVTIPTSFVANNPYEFMLVQLFVSFNTIYTLKELTARSQIVRVACFNILVGWTVCLGYDLIHGLFISRLDEVWNLDYSRYIYLAINGGLLLLGYPIMYFIERIFGFTSSVTLIELMNFNDGLLGRMSKEAQGTFNHSIQVGNLAAEVARKIGAKPLLARAGGLYHDIGKLGNPVFFTENQKSVNPHGSLSEEDSARIIIGHVTNGIKLANEYNLPREIKEFILTHHGLGMAKYFAIQWQNKHPEETFDPEIFIYPGPNPQTAEQAVLMMCDSVEAASRSLKEYTEESISGLVNKIIDAQLKEGCFNNCPITFRDIETAKATLIESLKTAYHTRIAYPELNKAKTTEEKVASPSVSKTLSGLFGNEKNR